MAAWFVHSRQAQLKLQKQAGAAAVSVEGLMAANCRIESATSLPAANWTSLTNLLLPVSPFVYLDPDGFNGNQRFYRAVGIPYE